MINKLQTQSKLSNIKKWLKKPPKQVNDRQRCRLRRRWAATPFGKCSVTDCFFRICPFERASFGKSACAKTLRNLPGVFWGIDPKSLWALAVNSPLNGLAYYQQGTTTPVIVGNFLDQRQSDDLIPASVWQTRVLALLANGPNTF